MDADLVGAAGLDAHFEQAAVAGGGKDAVVGDGRLAVLVEDSHVGAVDGMPADQGFDAAGYGAELAGHDGQVGLLHVARPERLLEPAAGLGVFGDDEDAGGVLVEAVDDAGAAVVLLGQEAFLVMVDEGVDEGSMGAVVGGVDDQAGRLVDDHDVVVLEEDFEGDVFAEDFRRGAGRPGDGDAVASAEPFGRAGGAAVDGDQPGAHAALQVGARHLGEGCAQEHVQPLTVSRLRGRQLVLFLTGRGGMERFHGGDGRRFMGRGLRGGGGTAATGRRRGRPGRGGG